MPYPDRGKGGGVVRFVLQYRMGSKRMVEDIPSMHRFHDGPDSAGFAGEERFAPGIGKNGEFCDERCPTWCEEFLCASRKAKGRNLPRVGPGAGTTKLHKPADGPCTSLNQRRREAFREYASMRNRYL